MSAFRNYRIGLPWARPYRDSKPPRPGGFAIDEGSGEIAVDNQPSTRVR